jgi:DNA-binding MarR family transcriptional regulator
MTKDVRDRAAEHLLALLPFYHKKLFRPEHGFTGMQAAQYRMLGVLTREGTLPMSELGKQLYISKPYMTILVDKLIEDGHVKRCPDTEDRRVINITITNSGKRYLKHAGARYKNHVKTLLSDLNTADLDELCSSLAKLRGILSTIT